MRLPLTTPVAYVGVDPNYGIGPQRWLDRYSVVCRHETAALRVMEARGVEVYCLAREVGAEGLPGRATAGLVGHPSVGAWLAEKGEEVSLLIFKPNAEVERAARERGWRILGAPASVARPIENKVNFFRLLDERRLPRPTWREVDLSAQTFDELRRDLGERMVIQGAHGFSGNRTFRVESAADFEAAAGALRRRKARASQLVDGSPMTMNACVLGPGRVRTGLLFHQVTGAPECTVYGFGACGNDWAACPAPAEVVEAAARIAREVGEALASRGFLGVFGLDYVVTTAGEVVTIECNPRLVSSVPMSSALEEEVGEMPLLASHLLATAGHDAGEASDVRTPIRGAQLVLHNLLGSGARVGAALEAGRYRLDDDAPVFVAPALAPTECSDDEFLLLPPAVGHALQPASECARVQMRHDVLDFPDGLGGGLGRLNRRARKIAAAVYAALRLEPAELGDVESDD